MHSPIYTVDHQPPASVTQESVTPWIVGAPAVAAVSGSYGNHLLPFTAPGLKARQLSYHLAPAYPLAVVVTRSRTLFEKRISLARENLPLLPSRVCYTYTDPFAAFLSSSLLSEYMLQYMSRPLPPLSLYLPIPHVQFSRRCMLSSVILATIRSFFLCTLPGGGGGRERERAGHSQARAMCMNRCSAVWLRAWYNMGSAVHRAAASLHVCCNGVGRYWGHL